MTASIQMYSSYDATKQQMEVTGNIAQGSEGVGFEFPNIPCANKLLNGYHDN